MGKLKQHLIGEEQKGRIYFDESECRYVSDRGQHPDARGQSVWGEREVTGKPKANAVEDERGTELLHRS